MDGGRPAHLPGSRRRRRVQLQRLPGKEHRELRVELQLRSCVGRKRLGAGDALVLQGQGSFFLGHCSLFLGEDGLLLGKDGLLLGPLLVRQGGLGLTLRLVPLGLRFIGLPNGHGRRYQRGDTEQQHDDGSSPGGADRAAMLPNLLAAQEASIWAEDGLRLTPAGMVAEGAWTNIVIEKNGKILTPPLSEGILAGVTRDRFIANSIKKGKKVKLTAKDLL